MRRLALAWALMGLGLLAGCRETPADHLQRARDAVFEKRPDEALVEYRKAFDMLRRDDTPQALVMRARALKGAADVYWLEQRKVKEAVSVYKELVQQCPESPEALEARIILAELLRMHYRDLRGAIDQLTAALQRNPPQGAELHYQVAKIYFELGDYAQCELESRKLAERFPTSAYVDDALYLQAQAIHMMEGRRQEASKAYADLRARFPDSELAAHALVDLDFERVVRALETGHPLGPETVRTVKRWELGRAGGVRLTFTDASPLPDGRMVFTAAAEDTQNAYLDGPVTGSAVGLLAPDGTPLFLDAVDAKVKLEGVSASLQHGRVHLLLVADADDPAVAAPLLEAVLDGAA
ncbi:MAG TPA: tetratricopeptide repeat protein [Myxococcus sp.]|nr:tetratricopeptide repeat protein [Myxococcus sp.]